MTEIAERLRIIRDHLRTGALGQRELWEEWLTEAAAENELLRAALRELKGHVNKQGPLGIIDRALEPKS